jgi:hypothetical protein
MPNCEGILWSSARIWIEFYQKEANVGTNPTPSAISQGSTVEPVRAKKGGKNRQMPVKMAVKPDAGRVFPLLIGGSLTGKN